MVSAFPSLNYLSRSSENREVFYFRYNVVSQTVSVLVLPKGGHLKLSTGMLSAYYYLMKKISETFPGQSHI